MIEKLITFLFLLQAFFCSCSFLSKKEIIDATKSRCYFYSYSGETKSIVYRLKPFNAIGSTYQKMDADVASFTVLGEDYARDKNNIYYMYRKIEVADIASFVCIKDDLAKDKYYVYYEDKRLINNDIDIDSFTSDNRCTRDKNKVYSNTIKSNPSLEYYLETIENANPNTYTKLEYWWGKDDLHYFFGDKKITADVNTFKIENERVGFDKDSIYYLGNKYRSYKYTGTIRTIAYNIYYDDNTIYNFHTHQPPTIAFENVLSLNIVNEDHPNVFFVDNSLFWELKQMDASQIDVSTFHVIDEVFAKDQYKCYYLCQEIKGADSNTFTSVEEVFSKDKAHVYFKLDILPDADPNSFEFVNTKGFLYYYKDKKNKWEYNSNLEKCLKY